MSKYQLFWQWFESRNEYIYQNLESDMENIALEITEKVKSVHPDLEFEIPFDLKDGKRSLIISADGILDLFDIVQSLVDKAPLFKKWDIIAFRPRLHQRNQIIDLDGIQMDYNDIFFSYETMRDGLRIYAYIKNYDGSDNRYVHLYFLLLDSLIGEFDSVQLITETKIQPFKDQVNLHPFPKLLVIIDEYKKKR